MTNGFSQENRTKVVLIGKFIEYRRGSSSHGKAEIDGIAKVDGKCQSVDDDENPTTNLMIDFRFLTVPRQ